MVSRPLSTAKPEAKSTTKIDGAKPPVCPFRDDRHIVREGATGMEGLSPNIFPKPTETTRRSQEAMQREGLASLTEKG